MSWAIQKTRDFTADFENLFGWYVEKAGVEVAWHFQTALDQAVAQLSIRPDLGRPRHFRQPKLQGLRLFRVAPPFERILIFYRAKDEDLHVVRLMHGARKWRFRPMNEPRLEHQNVKVKQPIDDYRSGRIVIPEFQRDYVWKRAKLPCS